jgi:hypothetical protein
MDEEKKLAIIQEEKDALDTPLDSRIHTVQLPPQTKQKVDDAAEKLWRDYPCFRTREDAEYFSMLPLSRQDSVMVLERASELERERCCK